MYKIYIKETLLILTSDLRVNMAKMKYPEAIHYPYHFSVKQLLNIIDKCEKSKSVKIVIVSSTELKKLKQDFKGLYVEVPAAGGIVINELGEALFIYKRGKWDLPKGKIEKGESIEEAAIREVKEETGLKSVEITAKLCNTKHTFRNRKKKRAIKKSYWYVMEAKKQAVNPQVEEEIEKVEWLPPETILQGDRIYSNLIKVIKKYQAQA